MHSRQRRADRLLDDLNLDSSHRVFFVVYIQLSLTDPSTHPPIDKRIVPASFRLMSPHMTP